MNRHPAILSALSALLLCCIAEADASALDARRPQKRKNDTRTAVQPAAPAADTVAAAPVRRTEPAEVQPKAVERPPVLDIELSPAEMDSLVARWNDDLSERSFDHFYENFISPDMVVSGEGALPDSIYIGRLRALASPVQLPYNAEVKSYILRYTNALRGQLGRMLALSKYYFPIIEEELLREGLPVELRILPVIESALAPQALSRQGAAGLWQFIASTGKSYGLEINSLVDERCDPVPATRAACRYLSDLHDIYNDWTLALAAYNCGPGNVNKALARAGSNCKTFWDIYYYLPKETRGYIPAFIGASYAFAYHRQHGIEVEHSPLPVAADTVTVKRIMHLGQVSSTLEVPIELLRQLNPQYKIDIIPATTRPYALVLPQQFISRYIENEQAIFAKDSLYLKEYIDPANIDRKRQERPGFTYTVKSGDTLGKIAARYRITVREIMRWNNLRSDRLRIGQRLRIERSR